MNKLRLLIASLLLTASGFAEKVILENHSTYPEQNKGSKLAVQWANSAREIEEGNQALIAGTKLNPSTIQYISKSGEIKLTVPPKAEYFRVLAWSKGESEPDFHTNWVEIIPNKSYTLEADQLVPTVLMSGMGC